MTHLKIEQENSIETVDSNLVNLLYKICTENTLDGTSNIKGNLYTQHAYKEDYDYLTNRFVDLDITVLSDYYIKFEDSTIAQMCVTSWGDGIGVTKAQIAPVTYQMLQTKKSFFENNQTITKFNELQYFTGIGQNFDGYQFGFMNNSNLVEVTLPPQVTILSGYSFQGCSKLQVLNGLDHVMQFGQNSLQGCKALSFELDFQNISIIGRNGSYGDGTFTNSGLKGLVDIPEGKTVIGNMCTGTKISKIIFPTTTTSIIWNLCQTCTELKIAVCKAVTPPAGISEYTFQGCHSELKIYVPDESVDTYKAATGWSLYSSKILPISILPI